MRSRMSSRPVASFAITLERSERSLEEALRRPRAGFVLECKRASPSRGLLRADLDPAALARAYAPFADAISVLTNGPYFRGSLEDLEAVRAAVDLPILCKDFIVDPYQVYEARAAGADAVLLMLSVLEDAEYLHCTRVADKLGLDVLTEVHTERELERARELGARIIGINSRDLRTLAVDRDAIRSLAARVPRDVVVVGESGVRGHDDALALRRLVDALLVGTALCERPDSDTAVRELVFGRVKVCGLTRPEDAALAWASGATHGGLVFFSGSKRRVTVADAARVRAAAPLRWVGVFVDEEPAVVAERARALELAAVQLHGEETPAADRVPRVDETGADRVLVDGWDATERGGTGRTFDWDLVRRHPDRARLVVAGGLSAENAAAAVALGCFALDTSSGLEDGAPGVKSRSRMDAFFAVLRGPGRSEAA